MPKKAKRACQQQGCSALVDSGCCQKHVKKDKDIGRLSSHARGYTYQWRRARQAFLLCNPICVMCKSTSRLTSATEVDHIVPHKGDRLLFWDVNNWQSLCKSCHSTKTATENQLWTTRKQATK